MIVMMNENKLLLRMSACILYVGALVKREAIHEDKMNERLEQVSDKTKHLSAFIKILEEHKTTEAAIKA